jgi:cell division protein FtsB
MRRTTFTGRAAILAVVVAALVVMLAVPVRVWLGQRHRIGALHHRVSAQEHRVAQLQRQEKRWQDPAFVRRQARRRLHYVLPGETLYTTLGRPSGGGPPARAAGHRHARPAASQPWYDRLMDSLTTAGAAPASGSGQHATGR